MARRLIVPITFSEHHIYGLRNVHVTWDGAVFHNLRVFMPSLVHPRFAERFQDTLLLRQWVSKQVRVKAACVAVCHDQWAVNNYYHWLVDVLPRLLTLRQYCPDALLLLPKHVAPQRVPDYIRLSVAALGFTHYQPLTDRQILHADCVILPELTAPSLSQQPELVGQVRAELLAALSPAPVVATRRVYAARAADNVRRLLNEEEVDVLMEEYGFEKVYFEQLSFAEQIQLMRETAIFLGVHGAGMTNMLFLPNGAQVIELLNEAHGDACYFRLASCLGLPYFLSPCVGINETLGNQSDMVANIDLLKQTLAALV